MNLFMDIETVLSQQPDVMANVAPNIRPPATTLKKPESINVWWANEAGGQAVASIWHRLQGVGAV